MTKIVSALLLGASVLAAAPASAADYLRYTIGVNGSSFYAYTTNENGNTSFSTKTETGDSLYIFYVPGSSIGSTFYTNDPAGMDPLIAPQRVGVTATNLTFTAAQARSDIKGFGLVANVSICGSFTNLGGAFSIDPSCSTASSSIEQGPRTGSHVVTSFNGTVTSLTVDRLTGTPDQFGFALVPSVPEPATWAMMLAGFAIVGAAMRRRPQIAVAA